MDTPASTPSSTPPPKSNAKKWIFFGCGGCLVLVVIGIVAFGGLAWFGIGKLKEHGAYVEGVGRATSSTQVQEALGTPVEPGMMTNFSVNTVNGADTADFTVPLKGPKGEGVLTVKASKAAGQTAWEYPVLEVDVKGTKIDLRSPPPAP
jgi:hypothetical protein